MLPSVPADEWLDQVGGAGTYTVIAEAIGDTVADTTYLASPINPEPGDHFEVSLSDIVPPIPDSGIFVRYHYRMPAGSDAAIDLEVELLKGTTIIANQVKQNIQAVAGWQLGEFELTTADLAEIGTDWTNLRLNFKPTPDAWRGPDIEPTARCVSWAQLQIPADSSRNCQGMIRLAGQADVKAWATAIEPVDRPAVLAGRHAITATARRTIRRHDRRSGQRRHGHRRHDLRPRSSREDHGQWRERRRPDVAAVQVLAWQFPSAATVS